MKQKLYNVLNIKASESKYVFDLLSIQLAIGVANALINIVSFTYFIHHFGVSSISYAYLMVAAFLLLLNIGYEKLEQRLSPLHLLRAVIAISGVVLLLFWFGLLTWDKSTMIFSLLVWTTLFYMVTGYAYWGLVSLLFNIRESKRVFAIVGSGDIPAKLIGYVSAPLLIPILGLDNLLLLAIGSLGVGFFLLNRLIHRKRWQRIEDRVHHVFVHHNRTHHAGGHHTFLDFFLKNKLIFFISLLSLLSYNVFNLIDYTFITQIKARIQNLSELATYVSIFFAVGRIVTLILKLIFTSRMIERLGIITCLSITPITLAVFCVLFVLFDHSNYTLYEFGAMAMLAEVLRSAMQEPVFFILFQPLSEHSRLKGHIIAKGYMLAPSLFIVGASLLVAEKFGLHLSIPVIVKVLLLNLIIWSVLIYFIRKAYSTTLHQSIARGVLSGDDVVVYNSHTIAILLDKASSGSDSEKMYALRLLEQAKHPDVYRLLDAALVNGSSQLQLYAFDALLNANRLKNTTLQQLIETAKEESFREHAIKVLCQKDVSVLAHYANEQQHLHPDLRKSIIATLLVQKEFHLFYKGCAVLQSLLTSEVVGDRELALDIISELKEIDFTETLTVLLNDEAVAVKRSAYIAACKMKSKSLLPVLMERLSGPDKYLAIQGLFHYGDGLFRDLPNLPKEVVSASRPELIKIAAKVKGHYTTQFLLQTLKQQAASPVKVIHILWSRSFQAEAPEDIFLFQRLLTGQLADGAMKIRYATAVPDLDDKSVLKRSIETEIWENLATALKLCTILYPGRELSRMVELTENKDRHKLYNGMEMLEMTLPKKTAKDINDLLDYVLDPASLKKATPVLPTETFFREIAIGHAHAFNHWTKALCVYSSWRNGVTHFLGDVKQISASSEELLLQETCSYVLNKTADPRYAHH
jgi:hypothetical protein